MQRIRSYLLTGIAVVVPVFLTLYMLFIVFNAVDGVLGRFINAWLKSRLGFYIPGLGILLSLLAILLAGFVVRTILNRKIVSALEHGFAGLPLVRTIYPAIKQIVLFVSAEKQFGFKKVALVEYPRQGSWVIGFLTNEQFDSINRATSLDMVSVFIPTTPGPWSGNVIFVSRNQVKFPDISVSEAVNIIISGGVFKGELKPPA